MHIAPALLDAILDHARRDAPNECCGFVALEGGRAVEVLPVENVAASPLRFEVGPQDLLRVTGEIEDAGRDIAIYHSHTRSAPYPSQTDVRLAYDPDALYFLVSLANEREPVLRAYTILDGQIATPMSRYPEYRAHRSSFGLDVLGSLVVEVEAEDGTVGLGVSTGGVPACFLVERHLARFVEGKRAGLVESAA